MSALSLVSFFEKQSQTNQNLRKLLETVVKEVELNEYLEDQRHTLRSDIVSLKFDIFSFENILEKLKHIEETRIKNNADAEAAFLSTLNTRLQFEKFQLEKLMQFELKNAELRINCEFEELQQHKKQKQEMYDEMEGRRIVQDLRQQQQYHTQQKEETEVIENSFAKQKEDLLNRIDSVLMERNVVVLELVAFVKHIQNIQKQQGKIAPAEPEETHLIPVEPPLENKQKSPVASSISFGFLEKIQNEAAKFPFLLEQILQKSINNQLVQSHELQNTIMVRSILRKKSTKEDDKDVDVAKKRVLLVASSDFSQSCEENLLDDKGDQESSLELPDKTKMVSGETCESEKKSESNTLSPIQNSNTIDLITPSVRQCSSEKKELSNSKAIVPIGEQIKPQKAHANTVKKFRKNSKTLTGNDEKIVWELSNSPNLCDDINNVFGQPSQLPEPSICFNDMSFNFSPPAKNKNKKKLMNKAEALDDLLKFSIDLDDESDEDGDLKKMGKNDFIQFFD